MEQESYSYEPARKGKGGFLKWIIILIIIAALIWYFKPNIINDIIWYLRFNLGLF